MQVAYSPRSPREATAAGSPRSRDDPLAAASVPTPPEHERANMPVLQHSMGMRSPVTDLRRPSIDVLMMPSGPSAPPTEVAELELGDPLSPRRVVQAQQGGRLSPVGEAVALVPEPEVSTAPPSPRASKTDRWGGGIVEGQGVYTGWMLKKGETGSGWKRRYFACYLASKTLSYYDKPGGTLPSGRLAHML